jgi:hypothetical protein
MWVRPGGIEKRRYWDFDLSKEVRYKTSDEYAAQFFDLFREAVRCGARVDFTASALVNVGGSGVRQTRAKGISA